MNDDPMPGTRSPRSFLFGCVVLAGLLGIFGWAVMDHLTYGHKKPDSDHVHEFDTDLWQEGDWSSEDAGYPHRLCMVDDLIRSRVLNGRFIAEVIALLGAPSSQLHGEFGASSSFDYFLGVGHGGWPPHFLRILFTEDGMVSQVYRHTSV